MAKLPAADCAPLRRCTDPRAQAWADAWVGLEPTFQTARSIRLWQTEPEDDYFRHPALTRPQEEIARAIEKKWKKRRDEDWAFFDRVDHDVDVDPWGVKRHVVHFRCDHRGHPDFEVKVTLDPETWEFSIKPAPLAWFSDARFVRFLDELVWEVPMKRGMVPSIAHGGCQFSLSAKTYLRGSLLADDIATKLNHPEFSTWIFDWPNPDDRPFRATARRFAAFRTILDQYWRGDFDRGALTAENALLDRGFEPGQSGPRRTEFQRNFAFARAVRWRAQNVEPGYWQSAHPKEDGYRPDQIMRYGEGNLNRLQIAGELHVKSGKVLDDGRVPPLDAPLALSMLATEASWENRGQMGRTSARDFVEALLFDVHSAQWLEKHPRVRVLPSLLQDQLLADAKPTTAQRRAARTLNLSASRGRVRSDWVEPETLFWSSWKALKAAARAAVANEAVDRFVAHASEIDPRPGDPMAWHRHRIHPSLWKALAARPSVMSRAVRAEFARRHDVRAPRPVFSPAGLRPPWE